VSKRQYQRSIPLFITSIIGVIAIVDYLFNLPVLPQVEKSVSQWVLVISAFAATLGATSLVLFHLNHVRKRTVNQWYYSILTIVGLLIYLAVGLPYGPASTIFLNFYNAGAAPIEATMLGLGAFYGISAVYRAFRGRSTGAIILLLCGAIVWIYQAPIGAVIPGVTPSALWILNVWTTAGMRAVLIGVALGTIVLGMRTLLGLESGYITRQGGEE